MMDNEKTGFKSSRKFMDFIKRRRNAISFWIFGMMTSYAYSIAISAAYDILEDRNDDTSDNSTTAMNSSLIIEKNSSDHLICNRIGTGAILLIDVFTEISVKLILQFSPKRIPYRVQVIITACSSSMSFLIFGLANKLWLNVIGVICASISLGGGEATFLSLTPLYDETVVSAWSSGTGAAGVIGSLVYAGSTSLRIIPIRAVMLFSLVAPALMTLTYFYILKPDVDNDKDSVNFENIGLVTRKKPLTFKEKRQVMPALFKYFFYLVTVNCIVFFINQGLLELLYFNHQGISRESQYRWHKFSYQVGYFVSLSSYKLSAVKNIWCVPCFAVPYLAVFLFQLFYRFIPSFWILVVLVSVSGVLHGVTYVSVFSGITNNFDSAKREFALGVITVGLPVGLLLAGVIAMPFHDYVCSLDLKI